MRTLDDRKKETNPSSTAENAESMPGMMPPSFSLTADATDTGGGKKKKSDTPPPKNPQVAIEGPLAAKGEGDSHAFAQDDIYQGKVGDCWVLATFAAIAKSDPSLIEKNIEDLGEGKYSVTLYKRTSDEPGSPLVAQKVTVSNVVPVDPKYKEPIYVGRGDDGGEIWPMILENAYVKLFGNRAYQDLNGGDPADAIQAITGQSATTKFFESGKSTEEGLNKWHEKATKKFEKQNPSASDAQKAKFGPDKEHPLGMLREWEIIPLVDEKIKAGEAVVLTTQDFGGFKDVDGFKLIGPHAYSVLSVDVANNTISLSDPYGIYHLYNLPAKILRTHFLALDHVNTHQPAPAPSESK